MPKIQPPPFDPLSLPESNGSTYPEPFLPMQKRRFNRRLGDRAGLSNFGVTMTRIQPGGQSSCRHAHSRQDEFVYILEGEATLETNAGQQTMKAGTCIGFPAGTGDAHRFLNKTNSDVVFLVVGDRTAGDEVAYPDVDLAGAPTADGKYRFTKKDGTSY
jgi:uncharacterized cupin superfamily protein